MPVENTVRANVKQAVPFLSVTNMEASLRFYAGLKCDLAVYRAARNSASPGEGVETDLA